MKAFYVCDYFTHKFSPGQPCQGVSPYKCVCVKFTLKLARFRGMFYGTDLISPILYLIIDFTFILVLPRM